MSDEANRASIPKLLTFLNGETRHSRLSIIVPSVIAGLSRGGLLWAFNAAAAEASGRRSLDLRLLGAFAATLAIYLGSAYLSAILGDQLVRDLLHRLRLR